MPGGQTRGSVVRTAGRGILAGMLLAALLLPGAALGHAGFLGSTPADGEHLAKPPSRLTLAFSEAVGIRPDGVRLVDSTGRATPLPAARADGQAVVQELPTLGPGWYLATWSVVSEDGHIVHGAAAFAVGDVSGPPPAPSATAGTDADLGPPAARSLTDLGQLLATGSLLAWLLLRARSSRVRRLGLGGSVAGATGAVILAWLIASTGGEAAVGGAAFIGTVARAAALLLACLAWWRAPRLAVLPLVIALAATLAGGHPGAEPLTAALLVLHLTGAAAWLAAAPPVLAHLTDRAVADDDALAAVRGFSAAAPVALSLAVGAGGVLGLLLTHGLSGVQPPYAAGLVIKLGAVAVAALLGALGRRRLARAGRPRGAFVRLFTIDTALFLAVIGGTGLLTVGAPVATPQPASAVHVGHCELELDGRFLDVTLEPARVGENTVAVAGGPPGGAMSVELRRPGDPGAISAEARRVPPSSAGATTASWQAGPLALPVQGTWEVTVVAHPDEFTQQSAACRLGVAP